MFILITRQKEKSEEFSALLNKNKIKNLCFPVLSIKRNNPTATNIINLKESNFVIFTSQNSVSNFMKIFTKDNLVGKKIASIGDSTSKALEEFGVEVDISPESEFSSENLCEEISNLPNKKNKIIIVKGDGGRSILRDELSKKFQVYDDLNIYKRELPSEIHNIDKSTFEKISHICITSVEILKNLITICDLSNLQISKHMIFVSGNQRIANEIKKIFPNHKILISKNPTNEDMLSTILD